MRTGILTFSAFLMLTIFICNFPVLSPEDLDGDAMVSLRDAIGSVKAFSFVAENQSELVHALKNALSTLQMAAGIKILLKSQKQDDGNPLFKTFFLLPFFCFSLPFFAFYIFPKILNPEDLFFEELLTPPPRHQLSRLKLKYENRYLF